MYCLNYILLLSQLLLHCTEIYITINKTEINSYKMFKVSSLFPLFSINFHKIFQIFFIIYASDLLSVTANEDKYPIVKTSKGSVRGVTVTTDRGNKARVFYGIPYAAVPERFRKAKPVPKWSGIKDCTRTKDACIGYYLETDPWNRTNKLLNEDCLYLDLIQPENCRNFQIIKNDQKLPTENESNYDNNNNSEGKCAVFVYIKTENSKNLVSDFIDSFSGDNVVVVSVAYRRGIFGFLNLKSDTIQSRPYPRNLGIYDLISAVRFINEEIGSFNGDTDRLTVAGLELGASLLGYLSLCSEAASLPLKQLALLNGGPSMMGNIEEKSGIGQSEQVARRTGCYGRNTAKVLACLKKVPAHQLRSNQYFGPCLDGILFDRSIDLLRDVRKSFPAIVGTSEILTPIYESIKQVCTKEAKKFGYTAAVVIEQCVNYYAGKNGSVINFDTNYAIPTFLEAASLAAAPAHGFPNTQQTNKVYLYQLINNYEGDSRKVDFTNAKKCHFLKLLIEFVKTGVPTVHWKPLTHPGFNYYQIKNSADSQNKPLYHFEALEFWLLTAPHLQSGYFFAQRSSQRWQWGNFDYRTAFWTVLCTAILLGLILLVEISIKLCNRRRKGLFGRYAALNSSSTDGTNSGPSEDLTVNYSN